MAITKVNPVASDNFLSAGDLEAVTANKGVQSLDLRTFILYLNTAIASIWNDMAGIITSDL